MDKLILKSIDPRKKISQSLGHLYLAPNFIDSMDENRPNVISNKDYRIQLNG